MERLLLSIGDSSSLLNESWQNGGVGVKQRPAIAKKKRPQKDHRLAPTKKDKEGNNKVNVYIAQIIDRWNFKGIKILEDRETKVKNKTITKIKAWLKDYDLEEIFQAIDNYFQILKSEDHYFSHE